MTPLVSNLIREKKLKQKNMHVILIFMRKNVGKREREIERERER